MAERDWISISIAVVALIVSAATPLFTVLLDHDDVRVVIGEHPDASISKTNQLVVSGKQQLTFINSGTRTASITKIVGIARRLKPDELAPYACGNDFHSEMAVPMDAKPFSIKPGEFAYVETGVNTTMKDGKFTLPKNILGIPVYEPKRGDQGLACIQLDVVTPDSYSVQWRIPLYKITLEAGDLQLSTFERVFTPDKPIEVLKRTSTIFSRY